MGSQRGSSGVSTGQKAEAAAAFGGGGGGQPTAGGGGGGSGGGPGLGGGDRGGNGDDLAHLTGFVRTETGESIEGARVELDRSEAAMTDAAGAFGFDNVSAGVHAIVVTAAGYMPARTRARAGGNPVVITLTRIGA